MLAVLFPILRRSAEAGPFFCEAVQVSEEEVQCSGGVPFLQNLFVVVVSRSQGVTLQVTLRCCLSVAGPPCVELTTPCQLNTAELKRLHLVCGRSMDSELICDGRVIEGE